MSKRIVIIGNSHGAISVVETLRREGFRAKLTLISEEGMSSYSPTALPYLLWEKKKRHKPLRLPQFYQGIEIKEDKAISIDPSRSLVLLQHKKKVYFDRLVIATGASPATLPVKKVEKNHILTLRKIEDLERIEKKAKKSENILIVGAGPIGLHLAQEFSRKKKQVHVVEWKDQILPGFVHPELAHFLKDRFEQRGIQIDLGMSLAEIGEKEVFFSNGKKAKSDLIISAIGIQPNLEVVKGTSITLREGIRVDDRMETNLPGIYACGDVAECHDFFTGESRLNPNVISAAEQGRTVAFSILGKGTPHPGLISINTFNCLGLNLFSLGRFIPETGDRLFEESDKEKNVFKRIVFQNDRLKGMVLLNTPVDGGIYYRLVKEKASLKGFEEKILKDPYLWGKWINEKAFKE
jgi:NAD(P)H-nitrite reductase large subunit